LQDGSIEARPEPGTSVAGPSLGPPRHAPTTVAAAAIEGMRPYQWLKNVLVFTPLAAAHRVADGALLIDAVLAFVAFSLTASALYLVNDLKDAAADRAHPRNQRPRKRRGNPIQPLSTVHGFRYADYSHGVRLVSDTAYVDGQSRSLLSVLQDPLLSSVVSSEGQIHNANALLTVLAKPHQGDLVPPAMAVAR
jgi:hypothetical protein